MSGVALVRRVDSRRRRGVALAVAAAALASLAFACAGIIGIGDRLPDDAVEDEGGAGFDRVAPDAPIVPGACPPQSRCVAVPDGWTLASLDPTARPGCAPGYSAPKDVIVGADGLGCVCKCTETSPGSCAAANQVASFRDYPSAGCGSSSMTYGLNVLDGGCGTTNILTTPQVRVPTPPAAPPACAADAGPTELLGGQTCASEGPACDDGGVCARALPDAARLCIGRDGDVACPAGFERKYYVGASAGNDTRKCGTCTCTPGQECDSPELDLFTGAACTKATTKVPVNGSCTSTDAGVIFASYRYTGKAPGCQPSVPPLLDGGVTLVGPRTLCCERPN